jgi:hypothetical protein
MNIPFLIPGVAFVLTLASGLWLSHAGKPLNAAIFNVHKLIALGAVVAAAIQTYHALKITEAQALLTALLIVVALSIVTLFVTGALMSIGKPAYSILLTLHNVAPFVAVIAGAAAIYLFTRSA